MDREAVFNQMMEKVYGVASLVQKANQPKQYGSEDLLYMNEVHTLKAIYERPGLSLGELAEQTFRTKGSTSLMVVKLVGKGLVEKRRASEDSRRYELVTTEKGRRVAEYHKEYDRINYKVILDQMSDLSDEAIADCDEILSRLIRYRLGH